MTAEIVNLRQARKRKARAANVAKAAENRERFGTSKSERRLRDATKQLEDRQLSGKQRNDAAPAKATDEKIDLS